MSDIRESHELFNKIADVLDFSPHLYNQNAWGAAATKFVGENYIEWDAVTQDMDEFSIDEIHLDEATRVDDACGTSACVAGWASLLSGYHPTISVNEVCEDEESTYSGYFPSIFHKYGKSLFSLFNKRVSYNYNVMCSEENVETPIHPLRTGVVQMEDCGLSGLTVGNHKFYRPDHLAQDLLGLGSEEAHTLFDADHTWEGEDLRRIGKGDDPQELLDEKWSKLDEYRCDECGDIANSVDVDRDLMNTRGEDFCECDG